MRNTEHTHGASERNRWSAGHVAESKQIQELVKAVLLEVADTMDHAGEVASKEEEIL